MMKYIGILVLVLFSITSCKSEKKFQAPTQHVFSKDSISLELHHIKLNEDDRRFTDDTDYIYFYPKINGKPTDVHIRAEIGQDINPGINIICGLYYYQGNPMTVDFDYPKLVKDKRLPPRMHGNDVYQTSYQEQLDILKYVKYICEEELRVEYIGGLWYEFEDIGEVNIDITEHSGTLKGVMKGNVEYFDFTPIMKKTKFAKDIENIFSDYNIYFKTPIKFGLTKVSYDEYAAKHNFRTKHDLQYVYIVNTHIIFLRKKADDSKTIGIY